MDIKKYEELINLVINENEEQASELFHEIVVDKSREIFESIMAEEMDDDDMVEGEGMGGQVGDLLDEINAEESGVTEDEDEDELDFTDDEEDIEFDSEDEDDDNEEFEDAVVRIEDKLDKLMDEFEEIMNDDDMDSDDSDDSDSEEVEMDSNDEDFDFDFDMNDDDDDSMMEAVELKKVSVTHGDNGAYTKSPVVDNSGQAGMDSNPVKFSGDNETVPTGPKSPSNAYTKGETEVKNAGNFKNSPGKDNFDDKGEAAPKPKHGDDGENTKSPVAESRKSARRTRR